MENKIQQIEEKIEKIKSLIKANESIINQVKDEKYMSKKEANQKRSLDTLLDKTINYNFIDELKSLKDINRKLKVIYLVMIGIATLLVIGTTTKVIIPEKEIITVKENTDEYNMMSSDVDKTRGDIIKLNNQFEAVKTNFDKSKEQIKFLENKVITLLDEKNNLLEENKTVDELKNKYDELDKEYKQYILINPENQEIKDGILKQKEKIENQTLTIEENNKLISNLNDTISRLEEELSLTIKEKDELNSNLIDTKIENSNLVMTYKDLDYKYSEILKYKWNKTLDSIEELKTQVEIENSLKPKTENPGFFTRTWQWIKEFFVIGEEEKNKEIINYYENIIKTKDIKFLDKNSSFDEIKKFQLKLEVEKEILQLQLNENKNYSSSDIIEYSTGATNSGNTIESDDIMDYSTGATNSGNTIESDDMMDYSTGATNSGNTIESDDIMDYSTGATNSGSTIESDDIMDYSTGATNFGNTIESDDIMDYSTGATNFGSTDENMIDKVTEGILNFLNGDYTNSTGSTINEDSNTGTTIEIVNEEKELIVGQIYTCTGTSTITKKINVRDDAGNDANWTNLFYPGINVTVLNYKKLDDDSDWLEVQTDDGFTGWISTYGVQNYDLENCDINTYSSSNDTIEEQTTVDETIEETTSQVEEDTIEETKVDNNEEVKEIITGEKYTCEGTSTITRKINIRDDAGNDANWTNLFYPGINVTVLNYKRVDDSDWLEVQTDDGFTGWVSTYGLENYDLNNCLK